MAGITFDTLEFVETLKTAGVPEGQAKAFATAVRKSDESSEVATKQDMEMIRREITEVKYDLLKWMVGFALTNIVLLMGVLFKILSLSIPK